MATDSGSTNRKGVISWRDVAGNQFMKKLDQIMLLPDGFSEKRHVSLKKDARSGGDRKVRTVVFDRDYVIEKIRSDLTRPLHHMGLKEIQKLVAEAYGQISTDGESQDSSGSVDRSSGGTKTAKPQSGNSRVHRKSGNSKNNDSDSLVSSNGTREVMGDDAKSLI